MNRRSFLALLIPGAVFAQVPGSIMKGEKAVVCQGATTTCPNGHKTCRNIDAPPAIGNDNRDYPEISRLMEYREMACSQCGVLFVERQ